MSVDIEEVKSTVQEILLEELEDPNTRRKKKGKTWVKTEYPSLDGTMPAVGVAEQNAVSEDAGVNTGFDRKWFETVRVTVMHTDRKTANRLVKSIEQVITGEQDVDDPADSKLRGDLGLQYLKPEDMTRIPEDSGVFVRHIDFEAKYDTR